MGKTPSAIPHATASDTVGTVGVFLPRKSKREPWRLPRLYARELRDMEMAAFINRANDIRLKFTPDEREPFPKAPPMPGAALGLDQKRTESGLRIFGGKRTKTRCLRPANYSLTQCHDNNAKQLLPQRARANG